MTQDIPFLLESDYGPGGDQPQAIQELVQGVEEQKKHQVLLGITGSGKTFTMANVIRELQRPSLVIAHNKTLAAQLFNEFKSFFPHNAVEYFVSYYDYYQPEAYVPHKDLYIEKDTSLNDELDRLRLSATRSMLERRDVIIVSSVSCIYGIGAPEESGHQFTPAARQIGLYFRITDIGHGRDHSVAIDAEPGTARLAVATGEDCRKIRPEMHGIGRAGMKFIPVGRDHQWIIRMLVNGDKKNTHERKRSAGVDRV